MLYTQEIKYFLERTFGFSDEENEREIFNFHLKLIENDLKLIEEAKKKKSEYEQKKEEIKSLLKEQESKNLGSPRYRRLGMNISDLRTWVTKLEISNCFKYLEKNYVVLEGVKIYTAEDIKKLRGYKNRIMETERLKNKIESLTNEAILKIEAWVNNLPLAETGEGIGRVDMKEAGFTRFELACYLIGLDGKVNIFLPNKKFIDYRIDEIKDQKPLRDFTENILNTPLTDDFFLNQFKTGIPLGARKRHTYVLGKSGSGKTELIKLFVYNDILRNDASLIIDPHGDLVEEISRLKIWHGKAKNKCAFISPKFGKDGFMPRFNPFEHDYFKHENSFVVESLITSKAEFLAKAFQTITKSEFTITMETMIRSCLTVLLSHKRTNITDLLDFLSLDKSEPFLKKAQVHWNEQIRNYFSSDFLNKSTEPTKNAIRLRLYKILSQSSVKHMITARKSSFNIIELLEQKKTVLIDASKGDFGEDGSSILGSFFLAQLSAYAMERKRVESKNRNPFFIYVDECHNFLSTSIESILAEARKFGVHLTMANQTLGQFDGNMTIKKIVLSNTDVKICGDGSNADKKKMGANMGMDLDKIYNLNKGKFAVKAGHRKGFVMQAHSFLLSEIQQENSFNENIKKENVEFYLSSKSEKYSSFLEEQIKRYYKKIESNDENVERKRTDRDNLPPLIDSIF